MRIQDSLVTDKQIALELSSENGRYRLPIGGKDYYFPTLEKVHEAFLNQDSYDTIKLTHDRKKTYLHLFMDEIEVFDTKKALRQRLSQDSQGMWAEIRNGKKHYYMQERGGMSTSYKEITEQECIEKLQRSSTLTKALGIGLGMLALLPGAVEFARHFPIGSKEAAMGLIALNQKSPVLGAVGYSLLPKQVEAAGTEFQVNTYTTNSQSFASIAPLNDGGFVVVWQSYGPDGDGDGIFGQRYDSYGFPNGTEFQVNTYTTSNQQYPTVAPLNGGGFVVTWQSDGQDGDWDGIYGQRYDNSGVAAGSEFQINTYITSAQYKPSVAPLNNGGFVVTWASSGQDGNGNGIFGQRYDSNGVAAGTEFQLNTYTTNEQLYPSVAPLNKGGFIVAWESYGQDGGAYGIYGRSYDSDGVAANTEFLVNTYTPYDQSGASVAPLNDGGFVVTWQSNGQDGSNYGIFGQRFDSSGAVVGTEFQVNTYVPDDQTNPSVAALNDGGFIVTWQSFDQDTDDFGIYAQRYDSSGTPAGNEFKVNTYTSGIERYPSVAPLNDGGFVITWQGDGQDGSSDGIFGQRYDASGNPIPLQISTTIPRTPIVTQGSPSLNTPTPSLATTQPILSSPIASPSNTSSPTRLKTINASTSPSQTPSGGITTSSITPSEAPVKTSTAHTSSTRSSVASGSNTQAAVSTKSSPTPFFSSTESRPTSSSLASVAQIIYGESYPILVNDQVVGSYTVSGGSGLLDSGNSNVISFEFDPSFQPVEGEVISLFSIPDEEVGLWESIEIEGESIECLEPHGNIDTKLEGSSYQIIFEEATCLAMAPSMLATALPFTLN